MKLGKFDQFFRFTWAIPLLAITVLVLLVVNEVAYQKSNQAIASLERIIEIRLAIQTLRQLGVDAETGQRGYLLTGQDMYLKPYNKAMEQMDDTLSFLRSRLSDNPERLSLFGVISRMLARKLGEIDISIQLRRSNQEIAWRSVLETDNGKQYMEAMRDATNKLMELINQDIAIEQKKIRNTLFISRLAIGLGALLSVLAFLLYLRQARQLVAVELSAKHRLERERDLLEQEVAERTAKLSELANHLETAREDERAHLARELHDELGALLTAAKLDVARLRSRLTACSSDISERIAHLIHTLNAGIALKRRIIEGLRPSSLSNLGLTSTLEILARESAERSGIIIESNLEQAALDPAVELTAYRFVQEALTNIMKYSSAKNVLITLQTYGHHVELSVRDDGVGFDVEKIKSTSYGLAGMRQRVEAAGGKMRVQSIVGKGTVLTASLPHKNSQGIATVVASSSIVA